MLVRGWSCFGVGVKLLVLCLVEEAPASSTLPWYHLHLATWGSYRGRSEVVVRMFSLFIILFSSSLPPPSPSLLPCPERRRHRWPMLPALLDVSFRAEVIVLNVFELSFVLPPLPPLAAVQGLPCEVSASR